MNSLKLYTLLNKNNKPNYKYAGIRYILVHKEKEPLIVSLYEDKNYPLGIYMQNNILDTDKYQFSFNSLDFLKQTYLEHNFKLFEVLDIFIYEIHVPEDKVIKGFKQSLFEIDSIIQKKRISR